MPIITCKKCGQEKKHYAYGICQKCYMYDYQRTPEYRKRHADKERERRAAYPERYKEYERTRSKTEKRKAWCRIYGYNSYRENLEQRKAYAIEYRKKDKKRQAVYKARLRARQKNLPSTLTPQQWDEILEKFDHRCVYCKCKSDDLQMEHSTPVTRNGGFTKENIVPACPVCNRRKKSMTVEEFAQYLNDVGESADFLI
jgi:5-methylcytosine-specific restriction endonuclease McrA